MMTPAQARNLAHGILGIGSVFAIAAMAYAFWPGRDDKQAPPPHQPALTQPLRSQPACAPPNCIRPD